MLGDHPVEVTAARENELQRHPKPMQRRVPRPDQAERSCCAAHAAELVVVLPRLQSDVVAEPLRLLVSVGVAADVHEQRRVVDVGSLLVIEADPLRQPQQRSSTVARRAPSADRSQGRRRAKAPRQAPRDEWTHGRCRPSSAKPMPRRRGRRMHWRRCRRHRGTPWLRGKAPVEPRPSQRASGPAHAVATCGSRLHRRRMAPCSIA